MLLPVLALAGCGRNESPPPKVALAAVRPLPSLIAPELPPPGRVMTSTSGTSEPDVPTYAGANEAEQLTGALRDFYTRNGADAPLVTSFDTLIKARLIKSPPVPPPGKKFLIDMKTVEVRLVNN